MHPVLHQEIIIGCEKSFWLSLPQTVKLEGNFYKHQVVGHHGQFRAAVYFVLYVFLLSCKGAT